jgi:hypothetical protein
MRALVVGILVGIAALAGWGALTIAAAEVGEWIRVAGPPIAPESGPLVALPNGDVLVFARDTVERYEPGEQRPFGSGSLRETGLYLRNCRSAATRKVMGSPSSAESSSSASGHDMGTGPVRSRCAPHSAVLAAPTGTPARGGGGGGQERGARGGGVRGRR